MRNARCYANITVFPSLYYHFFILLLFRGVTKQRINGSQTLPRDVCTQCARAILTLTRSYGSLYTLMRAPAFLPYFLFGAVCVYFDSCSSPSSRWALSSEQDSELMVQSVVAFEEMKSCHQIARHALRVLHNKAAEKKINVRLEGIRAPFHGSSLRKEQQDGGRPSGRLFQDTSWAHSDGDASGARAQSQMRRISTQDTAVMGLVWLQDMTPVGRKEQME